MTHAEKRADLKKWLAAGKTRQEKLTALRIYQRRTSRPSADSRTTLLEFYERMLGVKFLKGHSPDYNPKGGDE